MSQPDYFSNHGLKLRFPWRLYHGPIVAALQDVIVSSPGPDVLNLGSGPFLELASLDACGRHFTLCDVDERAMKQARDLWGDTVFATDVLDPGQPLPYADDSFDSVVSMDVIEHVPQPVPWVREALRVLRPNGTLFLTTPNYASYSLKMLEATALEVVARYQGFSRKHIHPTKMTPARLAATLDEAGVSRRSVQQISFGWVLTARAQKA